MNTNPITPETLAASVISVPPLARDSDLSFNIAENEKQIRHLEAGGVTTLLYGGNAILYHMALTEYADFADMLAQVRPEAQALHELRSRPGRAARDAAQGPARALPIRCPEMFCDVPIPQPPIWASLFMMRLATHPITPPMIRVMSRSIRSSHGALRAPTCTPS